MNFFAFGFKRDGRISRKQFFPYFIVFILMVIVAVGLIATLSQHYPEYFLNKDPKSNEYSISALSQVLFFLLTLPFYLMLFLTGMRRCRDIDVNPLFGILLAIPYLNLLFGIYLCIKLGTEGPNRFGPAPMVPLK